MSITTTLFKPRSIAVIGASADHLKLGHTVLQNILKGGYKGKVFVVNPHAKEVLGVKAYRTIDAVPEKVELGVLVVPAPVVPEVAEECGRAGVKALIVIAAGFREIGKAGLAREKQLVHTVKHYGMRLLGPNCLGLIDTVHKLNISFASAMPEYAPVAVLSQSGAMCTAILDWAKEAGVGFSAFVSLGNKGDLEENDFLEAWIGDPKTKAVLGYLEGIADGPRFLEAAQALTKQKPFVLAKAGVSDEGAAAITSHTGSLAGADDVLNAALRRAGVTRADTIEELFDYTLAFATTPLPAGNRVAIITNAGGPAVMTTDAVAKAGLTMATLSEATKQTLAKVLPEEASLHNPVDCIGDARASRYQVALATVLKDKDVDAVIVLLTPQAMTEITATAEVIIQASKESRQTVVASFIGGQAVEAGLEKLQRAGVAAFLYPERAVRALTALTEYSAYLAKPSRRAPKKAKPSRKAAGLLEQSVKEGHTEMFGPTAAELVKPYGITSPKLLEAHTVDEAVGAAEKVGYPVVMKIDSPDIWHKTDAGGVSLPLSNSDQTKAAYEQMLKQVKKSNPEANLRGVTVHHMIGDGFDFIVGAKRDSVFGPVVVVGSGGIYTEVFRDTSVGLAPLTEAEAETLIDQVRGATLLTGLRGNPVADRDALRKAILAVSQLITDFPRIEAVDLNPVRVLTKGAVSLDTKISLRDVG